MYQRLAPRIGCDLLPALPLSSSCACATTGSNSAEASSAATSVRSPLLESRMNRFIAFSLIYISVRLPRCLELGFDAEDQVGIARILVSFRQILVGKGLRIRQRSAQPV